MSDEENNLVAKCLKQDFGLEMTTSIINHKREENKVSISTIRRSAHDTFGGRCHNRATKKTGCRDVESAWARARYQFGLQLQQQFRVDTPGPSMIGDTVVKLFDKVPYAGVITSFNEVNGYYTIEFEDGGELDLEFDQLRVADLKKIDRRQVL